MKISKIYLYISTQRIQQDVPAHKALHCHVDLSWSTTQRPVETSSGPTTREMDWPGPEGQWNPPADLWRRVTSRGHRRAMLRPSMALR